MGRIWLYHCWILRSDTIQYVTDFLDISKHVMSLVMHWKVKSYIHYVMDMPE